MISQRLALYALVVWLAITGSPSAYAESSAIGGAVTFERMPEDFDQIRGTDFELNGAHVFDNNVVIGCSIKYYDTTSTSSSTLNVEGTIGYTHAFDKILSVTGSVGVGEHFQTSGAGNDFPYYVFRLGADIVLTKSITWNAVSLRYRNAFDTSNDYDTPEVGTGISLRLDDHNSISAKIERDWREDEASYTGVEVGYKYHF